MSAQVLLDTGPLVALLNVRDSRHSWAKAQWMRIDRPLLTCEAVLSEACFLLKRTPAGLAPLMELLERGKVRIGFRLDEQIEPVGRMLAKYEDVPMSLADACLVRMAELYPESVVLTLDDDFRLYRKSNRQVIGAWMPNGQ